MPANKRKGGIGPVGWAETVANRCHVKTIRGNNDQKISNIFLSIRRTGPVQAIYGESAPLHNFHVKIITRGGGVMLFRSQLTKQKNKYGGLQGASAK